MPDISPSNKLIAKNTLLLYIRQIITMLVSLYTSRVVLKVLGVEDYGIYNVVGGIVVMFSFMTATLNTAAQRYLAYELPNNNEGRLKETFSLIVLSFGIILAGTFILSELFGVWFLNKHMNIPAGRIVAANWVLQASIFIFMLNILTAPYLAVIIAHERMTVYAYISIVDAILKLSAVYLLQIIFYDKLVVYAVLMVLCTFLVTYILRLYCKRHFVESRFFFFYDTKRLKEMTAFAWWNTLGALANTLRGQGVNILLNLFFNPVINAARAIAYQVGGALTLFATNFYTAIRSQIIANYSAGDIKRMHSLIIKGSRFVSLLLTVLIVPVILNTDYLLRLWLVNIPDYSILFVRLVLVCTLIEAPLGPLLTGIQATGHMKEYNLIVSIIYLFNIPISYILLKMGCPPESTFYVTIILAVIAIIPKLLLCQKYYDLSISKYIWEVIIWCSLIDSMCWSLGILIQRVLEAYCVDYEVILILSSLIESILIVFLIGLRPNERKLLYKKVMSYEKFYQTYH